MAVKGQKLRWAVPNGQLAKARCCRGKGPCNLQKQACKLDAPSWVDVLGQEAKLFGLLIQHTASTSLDMLGRRDAEQKEQSEHIFCVPL